MTSNRKCCCIPPCDGAFDEYFNTGHGGGCYVTGGGEAWGCDEPGQPCNCHGGGTWHMMVPVIRFNACSSPDSWEEDSCQECHGEEDDTPGDIEPCCCCGGGDPELPVCDCEHYWEQSQVGIEISGWECVGTQFGVYYKTVVTHTFEGAPDQDVAVCCRDQETSDWPEEGDDDGKFTFCEEHCEDIEDCTIENGVMTPANQNTNNLNLSYSRLSPDRDGIVLEFHFTLSIGAQGWRVALRHVKGPVGFEYNETFLENGYLYSTNETPDWPVPDHLGDGDGIPYYDRGQNIIAVAGSGFRCYCGYDSTTNVVGEYITWGNVYGTGPTYSNEDPGYPYELYYDPWYQCRLVHCQWGPEDDYEACSETCCNREAMFRIMPGKILEGGLP